MSKSNLISNVIAFIVIAIFTITTVQKCNKGNNDIINKYQQELNDIDSLSQIVNMQKDRYQNLVAKFDSIKLEYQLFRRNSDIQYENSKPHIYFDPDSNRAYIKRKLAEFHFDSLSGM